MVIYATSPEVVFRCKSKMAAAKPEILLYQRRDELEMNEFIQNRKLNPCSMEIYLC